ncbi:hypothetical protein GCM10023210_21400 [Chryseobacterium ginsengisoli]|uniref:YhcG N-terminal domain-containing protein n=1 Tax=Chryseobacterium ginsengisoli TaxID=363853 RepID=A0ABP9MBH7_9FLAO
MNNLQSQQLLQNISALLDNARKRVVVAVNQTMVLTYYEIGRMIVADEQHGESRAEYGKAVLKDLSLHLTEKFGKGFSQRNLEQMRQFYLSYSISQTVSAESENEDHQKRQTLSVLFETRESLPAKFNLSWSHYLKLMRIKVKHWFNILCQKITNRFLQVNILQYYQAKKILLTF